MNGCPRCGSDRIKAVPLAFVSMLARPLLRKSRYACANCQWVGWRHRLKRRRHGELPTLTPRTKLEGRAVVFLVILVAILLVSGMLLVQSCQQTRASAPVNDGV